MPFCVPLPAPFMLTALLVTVGGVEAAVGANKGLLWVLLLPRSGEEEVPPAAEDAAAEGGEFDEIGTDHSGE